MVDKPLKRRGRPTGSGIPADRESLRRMADLMLAQPSLTVTAAIKQVEPEWEEYVLRRLRDKFKAQRTVLMAEAELRSRDSILSSTRQDARSILEQVIAATQKMRLSPDNLSVVAARAAAISSNPVLQKKLFGMHANPAVQAIIDFQNTPAMRRMQGLANMPAMRLAHELSHNLYGGTRG